MQLPDGSINGPVLEQIIEKENEVIRSLSSKYLFIFATLTT